GRDAIEENVVGPGAAAVGGPVGAVEGGADAAVNARREEDEGEGIARVERQVDDGVGVDDLAHGGGGGLEQGRFAGDADGFRGGADLHRDIELGGLGDFEA